MIPAIATKSRHIVVSITEARTIRDLFNNGFLDRLLSQGYRITICTEAVTYPPIVAEWEKRGIQVLKMVPMVATSMIQRRTRQVRRKLAKWQFTWLLERFNDWERRKVVPPNPYYLEWLRENKPDLVVATNPRLYHEASLISSAIELKIPTIGVVMSWDNVHKGINTRPERIVVWNDINKQELQDLEGYRPEQVKVIGAPPFDPYFNPENIWNREKFADHFRLDPNRPIIMFATLGQFFVTLDETVWMDLLIKAVDKGELVGNPQIICRLHPLSRYEFFQKYTTHKDVRLSHINKYIPVLGWYMDRADVIEMANMLYHSAVVITPGSTVTLEAAIFDKPTIIPVFHPYQPERGKHYFDTYAFTRHFDRIMKNKIVEVVRDQGKFIPLINQALEDKTLNSAGRKQLVQDYVHFTDGESTERLADLCIKLAETGSWD